MTRYSIITILLVSLLVCLSYSVTFDSLYDRELKSSYGFEILKHYHNEEFGNNDVKHFKGESMLFMTPWYALFVILKETGRNQCIFKVHEKVWLLCTLLLWSKQKLYHQLNLSILLSHINSSKPVKTIA